MNKEIKYTSHMKLMKKKTFKLAHKHARRCKLLLIQEKLDEQLLSHENQVELDSGNQDLSWRFSSQHTFSVEIFFLWRAQTRGSKFVHCQRGDAGTCSPFHRREMLPQFNCNAYPSLAFRRHSKFPESISRFTDLRSIKTHQKLSVTLIPQENPWLKNKNKKITPFTHPMCIGISAMNNLPIATWS